MSALEVLGEHALGNDDDRPTIPVPPPRESGVRLRMTQVPTSAATVDVVTCDLTKDPRSESFVARRSAKRSGRWARPRSASDAGDQNECPPSTSTVRALK